MFNSALVYELAVLKQYAQQLLFAIQRTVRSGWRPNGSLNSWTTLSASATRIFKNSILRSLSAELPERVMSADKH